MPSVQTIEQQLREWINQLAPEHKKMLLQMLSQDDHLRQAARLEFAQAQLRQLCASRNTDWDALTENERETFLDDLVRETELYATQAGPPVQAVAPASCQHCGHEITPADLYRIYFGERTPKAAPTAAKLIVLDVDAGGTQFPLALQGETIIGRIDPHRGIRPSVDLTKYDPASRVSRRHARITLRGNQYFIEDLGSANGTIINGRLRLKPQKPHALMNGDLVKIGETTLKFAG